MSVYKIFGQRTIYLDSIFVEMPKTVQKRGLLSSCTVVCHELSMTTCRNLQKGKEELLPQSGGNFVHSLYFSSVHFVFPHFSGIKATFYLYPCLLNSIFFLLIKNSFNVLRFIQKEKVFQKI